MATVPFVVPDLMQHRALALGEPGAKWLEDLEELLSRLSALWQITIHEQLSGATEALVFSARRGDECVVLKLGLPDSLRGEARTLRLARGRGYAKLLAASEGHDALLLERLGDKLADAALPVREQIEIICQTLKSAWRRLDDISGLRTGAEQAKAQAELITSRWQALDEPCPRAIVEAALDFTARREDAYDPASSVLVHGDAHIWNTLQAPLSPTHYKFVDPDGLFAEPALDLAISLREWRHELLAGDTLGIGQARCELLSQLTGTDPNAIWQWGFIEHVSCGLLDVQLGDQPAADQHFNIVKSWLEAC